MNLGDEARKYVAEHRERRAALLAQWFWRTEFPAECVMLIPDSEWLKIIQAREVNLAKIPDLETRWLLVAKLERLESELRAA